MEAKTDRRIKRTRYLLVHALTSLMLKKSIKDITVKELCESVDINRGTFYLHYKDIYDMLEQTEQELLEQFEQVFKNYHPSVIRNTFRMFGEERMILISDAMRATGMDDGTYELGGQPVTKKGRLATLKDGTIAGSATNLFDCMKNAVNFGIPLAVAVKAATYNPAKSIGLEHTIGTLAPGARADVLLLDSDLNIVRII